MRPRTRTTIIIVAATLFLIALFLFYQAATPFHTVTLETDVKVAQGVGINLDTDKLYFGAMMPGASGERSITLSSDKDAYVVIVKQGIMADWLYPEENGFLLRGGTNRSVGFVINPPSGTPYGNYTSTVTFRFYKPFMASLLD